MFYLPSAYILTVILLWYENIQTRLFEEISLLLKEYSFDHFFDLWLTVNRLVQSVCTVWCYRKKALGAELVTTAKLNLSKFILIRPCQLTGMAWDRPHPQFAHDCNDNFHPCNDMCLIRSIGMVTLTSWWADWTIPQPMENHIQNEVFLCFDCTPTVELNYKSIHNRQIHWNVIHTLQVRSV